MILHACGHQVSIPVLIFSQVETLKSELETALTAVQSE